MKPFNNFNSFAEMLQWESSLTPDQRKYLANIEKIEASKMKSGSFILNQKFQTKHFDFLLICLEYIFKACNKIQAISYNPLTTELKIL